MNDEAGNDVGEQNQGEPFQNAGDLVIAKENRRYGNADAEEKDEHVRVDLRQHLGRIGHTGEIGTDID